MSNYVPGSGKPGGAKLMIVGEAPGALEDELRIPFCGPSGEFLFDEVLAEHNLGRNDVWTTNVYKFRPPNNQVKRIAEVCNPEEEVEKLWREIDSVNPNTILCLGGTAFKTITGRDGITKWRGSVILDRFGKRKCVGSIHPANIVRSGQQGAGDYKFYPYIWKFIFKSDVDKAVRESATKENTSAQRYVKIVRGSIELRNILNANRHRKRMASDIESINNIPVCMSIAWSRYEAYVIPLLNKLGSLKIGTIPGSDQSFMWQTLDEIIKLFEIVGQNYKYDQEKMEMLGFTYRRGWFPINSDTLLKTHTIIPELPEKRMAMIQSIWTTMPFHKDDGKEFRIGKDDINQLFNYGGLDALSTFETDEEQDVDLRQMTEEHGIDMMDFYYNYVMKLHRIYMNMERIGFRLNPIAQEALKIKYQTQHDLIQARFDVNVPDFKPVGTVNKKGKANKLKKCHPDHLVNVAAPAQIKYLLYNYLHLPERTKYDRVTRKSKLSSDEDTIVGLINNGCKTNVQRAVLSDIIEDRRTRKTLGTYVLSAADYDGRIRGTYRIVGTETGRSSTAILKQPIRPKKSGHAFQTLTKHGDIGSDIRTMYIIDEGFVFVQIDLSQAEPRIVAVLSEDWELLNAFNSGKVDIHRRTAALVLDLVPTLDLSETPNPIADKIGKDSGERFLGKKSRNGGNYNMQERELAANIASDAKRFGIDVNVSEWRARKMLENFHRASPNIRGVFHRDVQLAINETRTLINPFGRVRQFYERLGNDVYKEGYATIPQATVADKVKTSIMRTYDEMDDFGQMLMGEAHDALLMRFPINEWEDRAKIVVRHFEDPIDFSINCTLRRPVKLRIPADVEVSDTNYKELMKVEKWKGLRGIQ